MYSDRLIGKQILNISAVSVLGSVFALRRMARRPPISLPASKRRKVERTSGLATVEDVSELERSVSDALVETASLNPLADLLDVATSRAEADIVLKAIFALYRLFVQILQKNLLEPGSSDDNGRKAVRTWLTGKLDAFVDLLCTLLAHEEKALRVCYHPSFLLAHCC